MDAHELHTLANLANESIWFLRKTGQQQRYLEAVDIQAKAYAEAARLEVAEQARQAMKDEDAHYAESDVRERDMEESAARGECNTTPCSCGFMDGLTPETLAQSAFASPAHGPIGVTCVACQHDPCECHELCGAEDGEYGKCDLPLDHEGRYHREMRDGKLWASWSGDSR